MENQTLYLSGVWPAILSFLPQPWSETLVAVQEMLGNQGPKPGQLDLPAVAQQAVAGWSQHLESALSLQSLGAMGWTELALF